MPNKGDIVRLRHMLEAANDAINFTGGRERSSLDADKMLRFSLVRCIEIIGEAASKLTKECQDRYPQIPSANIVSMRNRLIHAYYDINLDTVWNTVTQDLPPLVKELEKILERVKSPSVPLLERGK